jgi:rhamnosyltransferase
MNSCVEIVMRSKNDGPLIGAVLRGIFRQRHVPPVRLVHIDSGSTDQTVEVINSFRPHRVIQIRPEEYVPGVVLNRGMRETTGEWVVFLNSDAEPANDTWLAGLLAAAQAAPRTATAFSRQLPRPDCEAVYAHDYDRCFGPARESAGWPHFFSMVSCVVNRTAWREQPFREDLDYAEDDEWSKRLRRQGWRVVFAPESQAVHSHNYTLRQTYRRARGDAFAHAASGSRSRPAVVAYASATAGALRDAIKDWCWCRTERRLREWPRAVAVRLAQRCGKVAGYRAGWRHYHPAPVAVPAPAA